MKTNQLLAVFGIAATLCLGAGNIFAQDDNGGGGGGNGAMAAGLIAATGIPPRCSSA